MSGHGLVGASKCFARAGNLASRAKHMRASKFTGVLPRRRNDASLPKICGHSLVAGRLLAKEQARVRFSLAAYQIIFMPKRIFIVHGWGGHTEEGWFPWLKRESENRGFQVFVPELPDADEPRIQKWVPALAAAVGATSAAVMG